MQLVLDSNIYIFAYGREPRDSCRNLLDKIIGDPGRHSIRISRTILDEVGRNVSAQGLKDLWSLLEALGVEADESWEIPFELGAKYESMGLKVGDASIGAYAEWTGAEFLITENRDFTELMPLPFKVMRAEEFLKNHPR